MKNEDLVSKKKLIQEIEKLGTIQWEDDERVLLIPKDAVLLAISSPFNSLSPDELANIVGRDSWVLKELKRALEKWELKIRNWLPYRSEHKECESIIDLISNLESQAPISDLAKKIKKNEEKARAWDELYKAIQGIRLHTKDEIVKARQLGDLLNGERRRSRREALGEAIDHFKFKRANTTANTQYWRKLDSYIKVFEELLKEQPNEQET
jgi:hypothetical protein